MAATAPVTPLPVGHPPRSANTGADLVRAVRIPLFPAAGVRIRPGEASCPFRPTPTPASLRHVRALDRQ